MKTWKEYFVKTTKTICFLLLALCSLLFAMPLEAKVTGNCSNCHTMHNSQNGQAVVAAGPQGCLLNKEGCLGCHSSTNAATWQDAVSKAPIVFNTVEPTFNTPKGLAGGNFYYVSGTTDDKGHNVSASNPDGALINTPPGGTALTAQITCAGKNGCHGDRSTETESLKAIKGAHHTDDTVLKFGSISESGQGGSPGLSYRFLKGVKGGEAADWEYAPTTTNHNEYKGATSFTDTSTISYLCGQCHGKFHSSADVGSASPWFRHPTDISLPASGEYTAYTTYNLTAPVARTSAWAGWTGGGTPSGTVTPSGTTDDIIMCLSCHRAHASPYFKMMRWDYKSTTLSTAISGCNVCHTSKN